MITADTAAVFTHIVDTSGFVELLDGRESTSRRGRRSTIPQVFRLVIIGLFLGIHYDGKATIRHAHHMLTSRLSLEAQLAIGVRPDPHTPPVTVKAMYRAWERVIDNTTWTDTAAPKVSRRERARRRRRLNQACDQLMDVFIIGPTSTSLALDATGIRSWATRNRRSRTTRTGRPHNGRSDPDARDGHKTAGVGETTNLYGYDSHTLIQVPNTAAQPTTTRYSSAVSVSHPQHKETRSGFVNSSNDSQPRNPSPNSSLTVPIQIFVLTHGPTNSSNAPSPKCSIFVSTTTVSPPTTAPNGPPAAHTARQHPTRSAPSHAPAPWAHHNNTPRSTVTSTDENNTHYTSSRKNPAPANFVSNAPPSTAPLDARSVTEPLPSHTATGFPSSPTRQPPPNPPAAPTPPSQSP